MAHGHYVRERTVENAEDSKMKAPDEEKFKPHADRWSTVLLRVLPLAARFGKPTGRIGHPMISALLHSTKDVDEETYGSMKEVEEAHKQ